MRMPLVRLPLLTGAGSLVWSPRLGLPLVWSPGQPSVGVVLCSMARPLHRLRSQPFRRDPNFLKRKVRQIYIMIQDPKAKHDG